MIEKRDEQAERREAAPREKDPFIRRHGRRLFALAFWAALLVGYQAYAWSAGLSPLGAARSLAEFMGESPLGAVVFIIVYLARPVILFPASLLTIASGFVFGPLLGSLLTVVGSNGSAMVAYLIGRFFGDDVLEGAPGRLRENGFESVLVMRLIYLPYDPVSYAAGFLRVRPLPFLLATALGSIPGTLSFVLFGASVGPEALSGSPEIDWRVLVASAILLVFSLVLSRYFRRRERRRDANREAKTREGDIT